MNVSYDQYRNQLRKIADLKNSLALLQWDQETYLPAKGANFRGQQIATLSEQVHELSTDAGLGTILEELLGQDQLKQPERKNVELSLEDFKKTKKYPAAFVRTLSETISRSFHSWVKARKENSFAIFEKDLDELIQLKKQEAALLGYESHPYNALLNEYEKGCTVGLLDKTFGDLRATLKSLLERIVSKTQVNDAFLLQHYPKQQTQTCR